MKKGGMRCVDGELRFLLTRPDKWDEESAREEEEGSLSAGCYFDDACRSSSFISIGSFHPSALGGKYLDIYDCIQDIENAKHKSCCLSCCPSCGSNVKAADKERAVAKRQSDVSIDENYKNREEDEEDEDDDDDDDERTRPKCSDGSAQAVNSNCLMQTASLMDLKNSSRRPIQCPKCSSSRIVSFTTLTTHFSVEHNDVPIISIEPGFTTHMWIAFDALPFNYARCLSLLLYPDSNRIQEDTSDAALLKNSLPLVLMASRVSFSLKSHSEDQCLAIIWVAGLNCNVSYALEAVDLLSNHCSVRFSAPVVSLRDSQSPLDVFETGNCLVLSYGVLQQLSSLQGGFDLNVVLH